MFCTRLVALTLVPATLLSLGCAAETEPAELTAEQSTALEASITDLDDVRTLLPIEDQELRVLGTEFVLDAQTIAGCTQKGIVSGVWFDSAERHVFEGSWFRLGTGELGGSVQGSYADGQYHGQVAGPDIDGAVEGPYDGGRFIGSWTATVGAEDVLHDGELMGRYERRNEHGGYFFGVWADCGAAE